MYHAMKNMGKEITMKLVLNCKEADWKFWRLLSRLFCTVTENPRAVVNLFLMLFCKTCMLPREP
jgi:hypothetical protein